jgi:hypothetical protein
MSPPHSGTVPSVRGPPPLRRWLCFPVGSGSSGSFVDDWCRGGAGGLRTLLLRKADGWEQAGAAREARVRLVVRKDLEGERSPGRRGRLPIGNDRADATDSMAEQGLEADVPDLWSIEGRLWQRRRSEVPNGIGGNGKGATATATWCGCCRGESFEGCEIRRGEGVGTPDGTWIRPGVGQEPVSRETRRTP